MQGAAPPVPELGTRGLGHPQAQNFLHAIHIDANGQVQGFDPYRTAVAHLDVNAVHVDEGVQGVQRARLPGVTDRRNGAIDVRRNGATNR